MRPADEGDRERAGDVVEAVQQATEESVQVAYVNQGYTGQAAAEEVAGYGMRLEVVKLPEAKRGFRVAAAAVGSGAQLWLGGAVQEAGP